MRLGSGSFGGLELLALVKKDDSEWVSTQATDLETTFEFVRSKHQ